MTEKSFCCGQTPKRKNNTKEKKLPENPDIINGVEVIYLGSGNLKIKGKMSGLTYYVSDHRRRFKADSTDLSNILKMQDLILKP